jgi:4-hydroxy-2-oxoheptanedioate aldolase
MVLDGGAGGVIAPYVETVAQAQALRGAVKLRPIKGERLAAALRDVTTLEPELRVCVERRNWDSLLIIYTESTPALARLDELLAVPDPDAVLIGPRDLSGSLGLPEFYDDPRFEATVSSGLRRWGPFERFNDWIKAGLNLINCNGDISATHAKLEGDNPGTPPRGGSGRPRRRAGGRGLIRSACRRRTS